MKRLSRAPWMLVLAAAVLLALPATALGQGKRDRVLDAAVRGRSHERVPVIVTPRAGQSQSVETKLGKRGRKVDKRLGHDRAVVAWLDPDDIDALSGDPSIAGLSYDAPVSATAGPKAPKIKLPQLREMVAAVTGSGYGYGIGIAIIDSGIAPMPGLVERVSAFYDFTGGTPVERTPIDPYGHGTHVAGVAAGEFGAEMAGVASGARLIGLRVLDNKGNGSTSRVIDAVDFAVANRQSLGIDIINLSLGHPVYEPATTDPLVQAVERAVRAGIVVVTSAGNVGMNPDTGVVGYGGIMSPGNAPSAITVGAANDAGTVIRSDDRVERFSSRGPSWFDGYAKPDLVAPGVGIISASAPGSLLGNRPELKVKEGRKTFLQLSGTSMAAPVVSGVAALVIKSNRNACGPTCPTLTPATVKAILQYTATPLVDERGLPYDALTQGTGEVNAGGAVTAALAIDTRIDVGQPWLRFSFPQRSLFDTEVVPWSRSIVWGQQTLTGELLAVRGSAWDDSIVWGTSFGAFDSIVWGTSFGAFDSIVWGTNLVWGQGSIAWGTSIVWGTSLVVNGQSIVWGTADWDSIVWGTAAWDSIVWGTMDWDSIVWGTDWDSIVWGTSLTDGNGAPEAAGHGKPAKR